MPTTRQPPTRVLKTRATTKPDFRLQLSVTASSTSDSRRAENVEYQLIESSRRQFDSPTPGGATGRRTHQLVVDSNSSTPGNTAAATSQLYSTRRPPSTRKGTTATVAREYRTTSAEIGFATATELAGERSSDKREEQQFVGSVAVSSAVTDDGRFASSTLTTTEQTEDRYNVTDEIDDEYSMTSHGVVMTTTDGEVSRIASQMTYVSTGQNDRGSQLSSESFVNASRGAMTSSVLAHSVSPSSSSSSSSRVDSSSRYVDVDSTSTAVARDIGDGNRRSRDFRNRSIPVDDTTTVDRFISLDRVIDRTESSANQRDPAANFDNRSSGEGASFGFDTPEGAKVAALCGAICLLLFLIPIMSVAICRRQRKLHLRGSAVGGGGGGGGNGGGGKRKKTALQRSAFSSSGGDYSCAYDASTDVSLPLKRPAECCTGGVDCDCRPTLTPSSHLADDATNAAAARCRAKRYRTRVRDDVELERLHQQPDDWGTPPPSYRQLVPGSPSSLLSSSAACGTPGAGGSSVPTRRSRRPLFFGSGGVVDLSSTKVYDLVPEPPPPPLPPRAGCSSNGFRCSASSSSRGGVGKLGALPNRNCATPEINGKRIPPDQFYGYLMRSALTSSVISVDGLRPCKDHVLGRIKPTLDRGVSADDRASRRPLPRVPCDFVRTSFSPTVAVAVRCEDVVSPEDGDSVDRQRRRFPKMGRSCLMDSIRHRQALSMIASPNGAPENDVIGYAQSFGDDLNRSSTLLMTSPIKATSRVVAPPAGDVVEISTTTDVSRKTPQQVVQSQSTTV